MRVRGLPNPTSLKRIAPNLCRRESGFCGRMVAPPPACGGYRCDAPCIQGKAPDWIETALADGVPGVATVVNHSIVWQYLSNVDRARFDPVMAMAGEAATYNKPLAWLRSEPADNVAEVRLQLWTGSNDRLLARSGFHGKPVRSR